MSKKLKTIEATIDEIKVNKGSIETALADHEVEKSDLAQRMNSLRAQLGIR